MPLSVNGRGALLAEQILSPADLRARREALALSQAALAGLLGVTRTTVALWERSERHTKRGQHNLPVPLNSIVGREQDLADVKRLLEGTRLLTVTGTVGSGRHGSLSRLHTRSHPILPTASGGNRCRRPRE